MCFFWSDGEQINCFSSAIPRRIDQCANGLIQKREERKNLLAKEGICPRIRAGMSVEVKRWTVWACRWALPARVVSPTKKFSVDPELVPNDDDSIHSFSTRCAHSNGKDTSSTGGPHSWAAPQLLSLVLVYTLYLFVTLV